MFYKSTFEAISKLQNLRNCKIEGMDAITEDNNLYIEGTTIQLKFRSKYTEALNHIWMTTLPTYYLITESSTFTVPSGMSLPIGTLTMDSWSGKQQELTISISEITQPLITDGQPHYWRYVYPIEGDPWFLKLNAIPYTDDFGAWSACALLRPNLNGQQMYISRRKVGEQEYMIIDAEDAIMADEMEHRVHALLVSLGYITGTRFGSHRYMLTASDSDYKQITGIGVQRLQETEHSSYRIFDTRRLTVLEMLSQYDYQKYAKDEIDDTGSEVTWYYDDDPMGNEAFSMMANLCYQNNDMLIAASMLLDGSMLPIEYQMPFYHVALEVITSALMEDANLKKEPPMPQDLYNAKVLPILLEALNGIEDIPKEAKRIFTSRITSNLNLRTNQDKLTAAFTKLGYKLTKADTEVIKKRNSTFHGHVSNKHKDLYSQRDDMFATALRIHKLCGILLFKASGFSGKLLNNEVLFGIEDACCNRKEHAYIEI